MNLQKLETCLHTVFANEISLVGKVMDWHKGQALQYIEQAPYVCEELNMHPFLWNDKKVQLLTNIEFLLASAVRRVGKEVLPKDWQSNQDEARPFEMRPNNKIIQTKFNPLNILLRKK